MGQLALAFRLARRELRGGLKGFRIFLACLTLGVAAIAGVGSLSQGLTAGLREDARSLLGGDVHLRLSHRPATPEQRAWLERTLLESDATFKVLISPTPMIGPDDAEQAGRPAEGHDALKRDNHANPAGFQYERDSFFGWLIDNRFLEEQNFFIVCGDRHWQYHSIHPTGFEEFSTGALVDANSRLGRRPGDPESTDPEAMIEQPYAQSERSGGFLHITISPGVRPIATFLFHDERGVLLHTVEKVAR